MNDTIFGPNGMSLGTWADFWTRYEMPGIEPTSTVKGREATAGSTLGYVGFGAAVVSSAANIYSTYQQAKTNKALYEIEAQINEINQRIAESQAQSALRTSEFKIAAVTLRAGQVKSSQRASLAANGIQLGVGSAAEVTASTDLMKEIDVNNERLNGLMSAWGYRFKAVGMGSAVAESRLRASGSNPWAMASGSLGNQAATLGMQAYQLNKVGLLGG